MKHASNRRRGVLLAVATLATLTISLRGTSGAARTAITGTPPTSEEVRADSQSCARVIPVSDPLAAPAESRCGQRPAVILGNPVPELLLLSMQQLREAAFIPLVALQRDEHGDVAIHRVTAQ